jgi:hypothetical protein
VTPLDGVVLSFFTSPHPTGITRYETGRKTAFVFFTGTQSSGEALSAPLRDLWSQHGDVVVVEYNRTRFDGRQTAYDTYEQLLKWGYNRVILDGASLGGLLATDVIDFDHSAGSHLTFAVLMQDVPMDKSDLTSGDLAGAGTTVWYPGYVTNLLSDLFWNFNFHPPQSYQLGAGVDQQQLNAQYQASRTYPLSGWVGEIRYITTHRGFIGNQYAGIPLVVMQARNDSVVKPDADRWEKIFGGGTLITVPQSTHIGFVEYPDQWKTAFTQAFKALPPGW